MVLRARDPGDLGDVEDARAHPSELDDAVGPDLDRVVADDRLPERAPDRVPIDVAEPADRRREALDVAVLEAQLVRQQPVEGGIRRDDGQAARRRLVDDLVGRPRPHVVHERVDLGIEAGDAVAGHRPADVDAVERADVDHEALERHPVDALVLGQRRPQ